ncbi:sensor domain-containing diguanylate cyclase [Trinickia fusca]|uniref:diguanylate cyclase n=1 Tax=Trinickia fusca TaxID=2419777 RepID=A0A494X713_9BURK|nr:sensor domain-containing diguanylate cyclase [Trinickia fusca]RKP46497.1 sensor domain-containing diguanylate cyclase [Trinickia fusca]
MIGKDRSRRATIIQRAYRFLTEPRAIVIGGLLLAVTMLGLCTIVLYQGREDALERARETSSNLGLVVERDIERNFEIYDLSLQAVADGFNQADVRGLSRHLQREVLFDHSTTTAKYVGSMLVLDAAGNIVLDSANDVPRPGNFADRKYFTFQRDNPHAGLFISDPFRSRLRDGVPTIALSRRLSHPDGSFAGIALVGINLTYFRQLFAGLSLGPHGAISLIGRDGVMVMRQPYDPRVIGRNLSQASTFRRFTATADGSFLDTSAIDGTRRLYYFRNLPDLPLIVMVAQAESEIYAAWRRRAIRTGSLTAALGIGFSMLAYLLAAQLRRRMRAEAELEILARTDGLTGLSNRRTLGEILEQEWRRARRTRSIVSLLFVDIDRFKAYNDLYGHQAGDDALTTVAHCIGENIRRPSDSAARYGGEEFIVVLPDTPPSGAAQIAEKILNAVSDLGIEHTGSEFGRVTVSIGTASWTPDYDGDLAAMIRAADEALYQAKATGRNKVWPAPARASVRETIGGHSRDFAAS